MFTRNFQNLINSTLATYPYNITETQDTDFGESKPYNFKDTLGNIYKMDNCVPFTTGSLWSYGSTQPMQSGIIPERLTIISNESPTYFPDLNNMNHTYIGFGNADTQVTFEDYKLATILSTVSFVWTPVVSFNETNKTRVISAIVSNTSDSDITIKEFGLYKWFRTSASSFLYSKAKLALIYRELLSTPVTIPAGEIKTFNMQIAYPIVQISG